MRIYKDLNSDALSELADKNVSAALAEIGFRALENNKDEARKYLHLAMQLGDISACFPLGELYYNMNEPDLAMDAFIAGRRGGDEDCTYAYAALMLSSGDSESLDVIINYANNGYAPSISLLEDYYRGQGNKREAEYWRKKGASIVQQG